MSWYLNFAQKKTLNNLIDNVEKQSTDSKVSTHRVIEQIKFIIRLSQTPFEMQ